MQSAFWSILLYEEESSFPTIRCILLWHFTEWKGTWETWDMWSWLRHSARPSCGLGLMSPQISGKLMTRKRHNTDGGVTQAWGRSHPQNTHYPVSGTLTRDHWTGPAEPSHAWNNATPGFLWHPTACWSFQRPGTTESPSMTHYNSDYTCQSWKSQSSLPFPAPPPTWPLPLWAGSPQPHPLCTSDNHLVFRSPVHRLPGFPLGSYSACNP